MFALVFTTTRTASWLPSVIFFSRTKLRGAFCNQFLSLTKYYSNIDYSSLLSTLSPVVIPSIDFTRSCYMHTRPSFFLAKNGPYTCGIFHACAYTIFQKQQQLGWARRACSSRHVRSEPSPISAASAVASCGWKGQRRN